MIRVNLLAPRTEPRPRVWRYWLVVPPEQRAALVGLTMVAATAVAVGAWWWSFERERRDVDAKIAIAEAAITRLREAASLMERATARERDLKERLALLERLRATQRAPVVLLDTISRSLAEGLWLTEVTQTDAHVQLDGLAVSLASLTDFIDRLQTSGRFVGPVEVVATSTETVADVSLVRFAIRGEVASPAPSPGDTGMSMSRAPNPKGDV